MARRRPIRQDRRLAGEVPDEDGRRHRPHRESVVIGRTRDTVYRNLIAPLQDPKIYGPWAEHVRYNRAHPPPTSSAKRSTSSAHPMSAPRLSSAV
ncbi:hypothetical protein GS415_06790 [Rhodococcus hoagii]|nr:hypothetical protein [Prescottella equi]